jgi:hypothetical protein
MSKAWFDEVFSGVEIPDDLRDLTEKLCRYFWLGIDDPSVPREIVSVAAVELSCGDGLGNFCGSLQADDEACQSLGERIVERFGERLTQFEAPHLHVAELVSRIAHGHENALDRFRFDRPQKPSSTWADAEVYVVGTTAQDVITADGRGQFSGLSLAQLQQRYPGGRIMTSTDAAELRERAMIDATVRSISGAAFDEALGILPPEDLVISGRDATFKSSEHWSGRVTAIYARIDGECFTFKDLCTLEHHEIVSRVQEHRRAALVVSEDRAAVPEAGTDLSM